MEAKQGKNMPIGGTPVPKREIIELVIRNNPGDQIREKLKFQAEADLSHRLDVFLNYRSVVFCIYNEYQIAA